MSKLNWRNLLENQCPKCGATIFPEDTGVTCNNDECVFFISQSTLYELKAKMKGQKFNKRIRRQDNQTALNNLKL